MRNLLQNLLIAFALALCLLVAFQWHREAGLRQQVQTLTNEIQRRRESAQSLESAVKRGDAEILRLDALKRHLDEQATTNLAEIVRLKTALQQNDTEFERLTRQVDAYKTALETANASIKQQNESIASLNEIVLKFNQLTEDYNELAKRWNEQQEQLGKGATPAKPNK